MTWPFWAMALLSNDADTSGLLFLAIDKFAIIGLSPPIAKIDSTLHMHVLQNATAKI
jgi:hypothetical protein